MATVSCSVTINRPVDSVFAYVVSAENHVAWQPGIIAATLTPVGPVAVGSTYHYTSKVMGRNMETQLLVSSFEPNRKWAVKTTGVPRPVETVYLFAGAGNATNLTISMDLSAGGYPAAAESMIKQQMQKALSDQGNRIKQMVEK